MTKGTSTSMSRLRMPKSTTAPIAPTMAKRKNRDRSFWICQNHAIPIFAAEIRCSFIGSLLQGRHLGLHFEDFLFARVISGWRRWGSSPRRISGFITIPAGLPIMALMVFANSRMLVSVGLPMFTGSCSSDKSNRYIPSTRSLTKQKLRVWLPSP